MRLSFHRSTSPSASWGTADGRRVGGGVLVLGVVGLGFLGDGLLHVAAHGRRRRRSCKKTSLGRAVANERKALMPSPLGATSVCLAGWEVVPKGDDGGVPVAVR
jgi:hypothetical protein